MFPPTDIPLEVQPANRALPIGQPPELSHSTLTRQTSFLERFVNSFFHQSNIRWMLVIGAAIVFASSLMLVTHQWSSWPVAIKYLTIVAYTCATYVFAEFSRKRLGLQATASVMQVLTLLLLPIPFLSLHWLGAPDWMGAAGNALQAVLLILPTAALTWFISKRVFEHLFRGHQRTFHLSYCLLCVAGAMPAVHHIVGIDSEWAPWLAAAISTGLWLVMTVGVVKVNRHVFWMTEEHRLPRIFGFFPIALLGGQFLTLLATRTALSINVEWLGFGCVMLATTIFATGRSVAQVFKLRTGDLVRPLPWPIVLPIFVGLATLGLGIGLSFTGFSYSGPTTYAAVPTAFVAAMVVMWAGNETRHAGFVWCGLILIAVAYQCAPTLVADLVVSVKASAAAAVDEQRLPLAFYGLTYLPLLSVFAIASRIAADRRRFEFSRPLQVFVTILSLALLGLSLSHLKASLPVAVISTASFTAMAILFRDRRYIIGALIALIMATATVVPVANAMHWAELPEQHILVAFGILLGLMTVASPLDRWVNRLPLPSTFDYCGLVDSTGQPRGLLHLCSIFLAHSLSFLWISLSLAHMLSGDPLWNGNLAGGVLLICLALQTARTKYYALGLNLWIVAALAGWIEIVKLGGGVVDNIGGMSIVVAGVAIATCIALRLLSLQRSSSVLSASWLPPWMAAPPTIGSRMQLVGAFVGPLCDVCLIATLCLATIVYLPLMLLVNITLTPVTLPIATTAVIAACIALAGMLRHRSLAVFSVIAFPLWLSTTAVSLAPAYVTYTVLPLLWSIGLCVTSTVGQRLLSDGRRNDDNRALELSAIGSAISGLSTRGLTLILVGSLCYLNWYILAAAVIATIALGYLRRNQRLSEVAGWAVVAHVLGFYVVELALGNHGWVFLITPADWLRSAPYILPLIVSGVALFDVALFERPWRTASAELVASWTAVLRLAFAVGVGVSLFGSLQSSLGIALIATSIIVMAAAEVCISVRLQSVQRLWVGIAYFVIAVVFLATQHVLILGIGVGQIAMLGVALAALTLSRTITQHPRFGFASEPFQQIGLVLPGCVAVWGVYSSFFDTVGPFAVPHSAVSTLTMLAAAAIYFYHGTATRQRQFVLLALVVLNVALALAWRAFQWYDLQLYLVPLGVSVIALVELLRKEIPASAHDTLRYVGALTILVSPMLEILAGSWWHLLSLLVLCVCVVLASIGLRLRALMFTGTAFLLVDLVAMVIHSSFDHPQVLWVAGLAIGAGVIALAAICENQREHLLGRIRLLTAELATWR